MIKAIFAMDSGGGIGLEKKKPWDKVGEYGLPWPRNDTDLEHFKSTTEGHIVVMGRKTWESLPESCRPLPGRINAVVSSRAVTCPNTFIHNIKPANIDVAIKNLESQFDKDVFIIGGKQLLMSTLHLIEFMHVTHIRGMYEANLRLDKRILLEDFELRSASPLYGTCAFEEYARENVFNTAPSEFIPRI